MKPIHYYFFRRGVLGLYVPRFARRIFAGTTCHRMYVFGGIYGLGFYRTERAGYRPDQ